MDEKFPTERERSRTEEREARFDALMRTLRQNSHNFSEAEVEADVAEAIAAVRAQRAMESGNAAD